MFAVGDIVRALTGPHGNTFGTVAEVAADVIKVAHSIENGRSTAVVHYKPTSLELLAAPEAPSPAAPPVFTVNANGGKKHTGGKPTANQVPEAFIEALSRHMDIGAVKYDFANWWKGLTFSQPSESIRRHNALARAGEAVDPETGSSHWVAIAANAMMAWTLEQNGRLEDDRSKVFIDFVIAQAKKEQGK